MRALSNRRGILAASFVLTLLATTLACTPAKPPSALPSDGTSLSERQLDHLEALAEIYRHVRWFHPSDEVARAPWDAVLVMTTRALLAAPDDAAAAGILRAHFDPLTSDEEWSEEPFEPLSDAAVRERLDAPDAVRWLHRGVGEDQALYLGQRVAAGSIDALDIATLDLLPTLHLRLPLVLPGKAEELIEFNSEWGRPRSIPYDDLASRLAAIIELWATVELGFPYHDVISADWSEALRPSLIAAAGASPGDEMMKVLQRMMVPLEDAHVELQYRGFPGQVALMLQRLDGDIVVTGRAPDLEAIALGDVLVSIDGKPAHERLAEEMALISGSEPWKEFIGLKAILRAKRGTTLGLGFADGKTLSVPAVSGGEANSFTEGFRPEALAELEDGVLYFDIGRIAPDDVEGAIRRWRTARAVLFDMRGYPRGGHAFLESLATRPLHSANFLVGRIRHPDWRTVEYGEGNMAWQIEANEEAVEIPVAMLIDGRSYSYAESISGLFKGEALGPLVGTRTAGANGNVTCIAVPGDYHVCWTGMRVTNRDGSRHHGVGVEPDIVVRPTVEGVRSGRDEVLEAGLSALQERLSG